MGVIASITIERHNPLLSEGQQSYSYPFTIPRTGRNDRILDFPARFQRSGWETQSDFACTLVCGHVQRAGILHINGIARDTYDCSMTYDTAGLLRDIGDKKLAELGWPPVDYDSKDDLVDKLRNNFLYGDDEESYLSGKAATFPVIIAQEKGKYPSGFEGFSNTILNNFLMSGGVYDLASTEYVAGGNVVELEPPFGLAPFLRVDYALRFIFEEVLGYQLSFGSRAYNPLEHICMLHNCADAVVDKTLRLKQLVADCTVKEFVQSVENMFCSKFILNTKANVVRWVLWKDYLRGLQNPNDEMWVPLPDVIDGGAPKPYGMDLRPYLEGSPEVSMQERRAIKLTMQRNVGSSVVTPEEFYSDDVMTDYKVNLYGSALMGKHEDVRAGMLKIANRELCCNTFNCFNTQAGASEDRAIAAEHLPTMNNTGFVGVGICPCYTFGISFFNSTPPADPNNPDSVKEDKKATRPLAFSTFYHDSGVTMGTTIGVFALPPISITVQSLRLHQQEGLFNAYHYLRDRLLRQGVYSLTVTLDSSVAISENELYLFDGQPVMVESVLETLGAATQVVKLQTVKITDDNS